MRRKNFLQVYATIQNCIDKGIAHAVSGNNGSYPNNLLINGENLVNFAMCDYLGLSNDERLKEGAIKAIRDYGVYTAVSKTYFKLDIYEEAEGLLSTMFKKPVLLFPRTTLAHIGVLPAITNSNEAILIDHQAHTSMRITTDMLKSYGNYVETIRHNKVELIEERIKELQTKYSKVWYLTDSVFSMYGDTLHFNGLKRLLDEYDQFRLYVDDAHGMSWQGANGTGYLLNNLPYHPHMVLITSLGKGFGAGGGAVICNDEEMKSWISTCASPLIFSLPICPATLGAIIESAKIHLSSEIYSKQEIFKDRMDLFEKTANELNLPLMSHSGTPLFFIAAGQADFANEISQEVMKNGYFLSVSHYPAVPINNSGIRISTTLHNSNNDIVNMLHTLSEAYKKALSKRNMSMVNVLSNYKTSMTAV